MMAGRLRGVFLGLVLAVGGCGMFGDDDERLEGQRIPVREAVRGAVVQPAAPAAALPESEVEADAN